MSEIKDGGPAFPDPGRAQSTKQREVLTNTGMTLRDYFAAKALAAMIGQPNKDHENCGKKAVPRLAQFAYEYADAMIAARAA